MAKIELTKSQVSNLKEFFEFHLIAEIRQDEYLDNIEWLCDMCDIYTKLKNEERKDKQHDQA